MQHFRDNGGRGRSVWRVLIVSVAMFTMASCTSGAGSLTTTTNASSATTAATDSPATTTSQAGEDRQELVVRLYTQDMQNVDPALIPNAGSWWVAQNVYSGLVRSDLGIADLDQIQPDLAERWEVSDDGTVYTFFLRQGVQWHKGYGEVTANDVKFSFDRIKDPELGSPYAQLFDVLEEVEVVDDYTVRLHMSSPHPPFLTSTLTWRPGYIVSERALTEIGVEDHAISPIGSGPFVFESWEPDSEVYLAANDDYFLGPPNVSGVRMRVIPDEDAVALALESGELHLANLQTSESLEILETNDDIEIQLSPSTAGRYLLLDTQNGPLADIQVRRALWHATDTDLLASGVFDDWHIALDTIYLPSLWAFTDDVPKYEYDVDTARQLLAEAGYADGLDLSLLYSQRPQENGIALALQEMWREAGVNLELIGLDHPVFTSEHNENREAYDIVLQHFGRTSDPHSFLADLFHSEGGSNLSFYGEIDELIEAGSTEPDVAAREAIYHDIQVRLQEDVPAVPLINTTAAFAIRQEVQGHVTGVNLGFVAYPIELAAE